jgi:DNA-binding transcriptional LysR family regulator
VPPGAGADAAAERAITGQQKVPSGLLRISIGTLYANYRLLPLLEEFTTAYPQIELELSLSNRVVDIVEEGYDLAIRIGTPQDSRLVVQKLEDATLGIFATPGYLARRGVPQNIDELAGHDCLQFILPSTGRAMPWLLTLPDGQRWTISSIVACACWTMPKAASAGDGRGRTVPDLSFHCRARTGSRRAGGSDAKAWRRARQFSITYPQNRHLSARVRAFVDFLRTRLRQPA